jgi:hypothetical protein
VANVLTVVWFVIAYVVMNSAIQVWAGLMLPGPVERARERVERRPVACFFLGALILGITAAFSLSMLAAGSPGPVQLLGWIVAGPMLAGSIVGGSAISQLLAGRMQAQMRTESRMLALVSGALCTTLASLLPIIGWFVFLPIVGMISIGAGTLALFKRKRKQVERQPEATAFTSDLQQFVLPAQGSAASQYSETRVSA